MKLAFLVFLLLIPLSTFGADSPAVKSLRVDVARQLPAETRIEIANARSIKVIPGGAKVRVLSPQPPLGLVSFEATWNEGDGEKKTSGTAVIRAYAKVAVTKGPLRHGDPLSHTNIAFEERELSTHAYTGFYPTWESLQGSRAKGFVRTGAVLGTSQVELPKAVAQGEMVDLIWERGSLRMTAKVKALEPGGLEQWIRVENPTTKRTLQARVRAPGEVAIR